MTQVEKLTLTPACFEAALQQLDAMPRSTLIDRLLWQRNRFVLLLLARTGIPVSRAARADMAHISLQAGPSDEGWVGATLSLVNRPGHAEVAFDAVLATAFVAYRKAFGLSARPSAGERYALILSPFTADVDGVPLSLHGRRAHRLWLDVRHRQSVWNIVRESFALCAAACRRRQDPATAALLEAVTPMALRQLAQVYTEKVSEPTRVLLQGLSDLGLLLEMQGKIQRDPGQAYAAAALAYFRRSCGLLG